jgi:hypothetical protein
MNMSGFHFLELFIIHVGDIRVKRLKRVKNQTVKNLVRLHKCENWFDTLLETKAFVNQFQKNKGTSSPHLVYSV